MKPLNKLKKKKISKNSSDKFFFCITGEDFHLFSCGSFIKNKRIPDEQTKHDVFDILRNNLAYSVAGKKKFLL